MLPKWRPYGIRSSSRLGGKIESKVYDLTIVNNDKENLGNKNKIESKHANLPQFDDDEDEESYDSFEYDDEDEESDDDDDEESDDDDDEDSMDSRKIVDLNDDFHFEERCRLTEDRSKIIMDKDHGYAIDITYDAVVTRELALEKVLEMTKMDSGSLRDESTNKALAEMKLFLIGLVYRSSSIHFACYDADYRHDREKVCHSALMFETVNPKGSTKFELLRQEKKQYDNDIE